MRRAGEAISRRVADGTSGAVRLRVEVEEGARLARLRPDLVVDGSADPRGTLYDGRARVVLLSTLCDLESDEPVDAIFAHLLPITSALRANGARLVLANLFRHVPGQRQLLDRARRINLAVVEASRALGSCVLDVDRALSARGARAYRTDIFLRSTAADEVLAHELADLLLVSGLLAD